MKKIVRYTIGIVLLILGWNGLCAQFQPAPVNKSQEKTIVNGKIYFIHTVQKNQTLFSISKTYEVTQDEIKNANPGIDVVNLTEGLALRIPEPGNKQAAVYPENREDFHAHVVKRRETLYSLARKYKVEESIIHYYNPWAKYGIKQDQTLWIPRNKELHDIASDARTDDAYYYYTTKEKDTLYSIARIYGVEVSDIIEANPELRNGLKPEQNLKIPRVKIIAPPEGEAVVPGSIPCTGPLQPYTFKVAVMLPFFATYNAEEMEVPSDTLAEEGTYVPQSTQRGLRGRNFAEFYEGFLLAVDSLKRTGLSVNLHVYDTERDTLRTKRIVRELSAVQPDMIIGPVYAEDVSIAGRLAYQMNIPLISPLSTRSSLIRNNPNIIQVVPSRQDEGLAMANYIRQFNKGRIILIRGTDMNSQQNSWRFKKYLLENMPVSEAGTPLYFADYRLNDSLYTQLGKILSRDEENLLVVFSDDEPEVNSLITRLILRASQFPITLFGLPSWQGFSSTDLTFLHNLHLNIISPFYTDFSDPRIRHYLKKSRAIYGYEPYEISQQGYNFSMLGYDIGLYFLTALKQMGRNFMPCADQVQATQLLTRYHFLQVPDGGYVNYNFNVVRYKPDFSVEKAGIITGQPINNSTE